MEANSQNSSRKVSFLLIVLLLSLAQAEFQCDLITAGGADSEALKLSQEQLTASSVVNEE